MSNTLYNDIEDLERNLTRKPAAVDVEPIDVDGYLSDQPSARQLMPVPKSSIPDPSKAKVPSSHFSKESVVGAVDPDYSGYDELIKGLKKPRDTSNQDLMNMGISTAIGALMGRTAVGAKVAGDYGLERANKQEKREDSFEDQLLKLNALKAAQMAKGKKGTKVKSGGSSNWRSQIRLGKDGAQYWMENVDPETGKFQPSEDDQRLTPMNATIETLTNFDGSKKQVPRAGNMLGDSQVGSLNPKLALKADAEGRLQGVNEYDVSNPQEVGQGSNFNKTSRNLSQGDDKYYTSVEKEFSLKSSPSAIANTEAQNALTAIGDRNDAGAIVGLKSVIRAMEQGKMSDKDFDVVKDNLGSSWATRLDSWQGKVLDGQPLNDSQRRVLKDIAVTLKNNTEREHQRVVNSYNEKLGRTLQPEEYSRLRFKPQLRGYSDEIQRKEADRINAERNKYSYENYVLKKDPTGRVWKTSPTIDPKTGKFKVIEEYLE